VSTLTKQLSNIFNKVGREIMDDFDALDISAVPFVWFGGIAGAIGGLSCIGAFMLAAGVATIPAAVAVPVVVAGYLSGALAVGYYCK
jgi:hypothetical protein